MLKKRCSRTTYPVNSRNVGLFPAEFYLLLGKLFSCLDCLLLKAVCTRWSPECTQQLVNSKHSDICETNKQERRQNINSTQPLRNVPIFQN